MEVFVTYSYVIQKNLKILLQPTKFPNKLPQMRRL